MLSNVKVLLINGIIVIGSTIILLCKAFYNIKNGIVNVTPFQIMLIVGISAILCFNVIKTIPYIHNFHKKEPIDFSWKTISFIGFLILGAGAINYYYDFMGNNKVSDDKSLEAFFISLFLLVSGSSIFFYGIGMMIHLKKYNLLLKVDKSSNSK